jgi:hypothetical protein
LAGICAFVVLLSAVFVVTDHRPPEWDQSHYLTVANAYVAGFHDRGLRGLLHMVNITDAAHGPLYTVAISLPVLLFGSSPFSALLVNLVIWPVLLMSVAYIGAVLVTPSAGLLAAMLTATMPLMAGLSHEVLADFLLVVLTAATVAILIRSDFFGRVPAGIAAGVVLGLGTWAKVTYISFVIGPLLLTLVGAAILVRRELVNPETRRQGIRRAMLALASLAVAAAIAAAWYLPHLDATLAYVRATTSGPLSVGAGPASPLTLSAISTFTLGVVNNHLGWLVVVAGLVSACAIIVRNVAAVAHLRRPRLSRGAYSAGVLGTWSSIPFISVGTSVNQDVRLMAAAVPAVAIIIAALIVKVPQRILRRGLATVVCAAGVLLALQFTWPLTAPGASTLITVSTPVGTAYYPLSISQLGYDRIPEPTDYLVPVLADLEARANSRAKATLVVGVLQSHRYINLNTLPYVASVRGDHLVWREVHATGDAAQLRRDLLACDVILFVPPNDPPGSRTGLVNQDFAAAHMTPGLLALFAGPERAFPLDEGDAVRVLEQPQP